MSVRLQSAKWLEAIFCCLIFPSAGFADDAPATLVEPAPADSSLEDRELADRAVASAAEAAAGLNTGGSIPDVISRQKAAANDLDELLKRLQQRAQSSSSSQKPQDQPQSQSQQSAQPSPQSNPEQGGGRDAANSNANATEGQAGEAVELAHRRDLAQSVWGHLPPKMQEELRRSFSEKFVAKYEQMIRQYYEALAEQSQRKPKE
jgi:hypothetical protein